MEASMWTKTGLHPKFMSSLSRCEGLFLHATYKIKLCELSLSLTWVLFAQVALALTAFQKGIGMFVSGCCGSCRWHNSSIIWFLKQYHENP